MEMEMEMDSEWTQMDQMDLSMESKPITGTGMEHHHHKNPVQQVRFLDFSLYFSFYLLYLYKHLVLVLAAESAKHMLDVFSLFSNDFVNFGITCILLCFHVSATTVVVFCFLL